MDDYQLTVDLEFGKVGASFWEAILGLMSHTMSRRYKRPDYIHSAWHYTIEYLVVQLIKRLVLVSNDYTSAVNTF